MNSDKLEKRSEEGDEQIQKDEKKGTKGEKENSEESFVPKNYAEIATRELSFMELDYKRTIESDFKNTQEISVSEKESGTENTNPVVEGNKEDMGWSEEFKKFDEEEFEYNQLEGENSQGSDEDVIY